MLYLVLSRYWYRTFSQTYSATSPFNPHWEMDKNFSPSYSSSQTTYVEAESVKFLRFRFHSKRTASKASSFRFHIPALMCTNTQDHQNCRAVKSHSCALATFQSNIKARKKKAIWMNCVFCLYFDKIVYLLYNSQSLQFIENASYSALK